MSKISREDNNKKSRFGWTIQNENEQWTHSANSEGIQQYLAMQARNYIDLLSSDSEDEKPPIIERSIDMLEAETKSLSIDPQKKKECIPKATMSAGKLTQAKTGGYEQVGQFDVMKETGTLTGHFLNFKEFMQHSSKNILFLFGPSGCGKTLLVTTALKNNKIPYQFAQPQLQESQSDDLQYQDTADLITRLLSSHDMLRQKTYLFKDFPIAFAESGTVHSIKVSDFRRQLHGLVGGSHNRNKYIFMLNTQIYSSYAILSEQSESKALGKLPNVIVMKMDPYGIRDMKQIIEHFVKLHNHYAHLIGGKNIDEIVTQANGDARKALNLLYHRRLAENARLIANRKINVPKIKFYGSETSEIKKTSSNLSMTGSKQVKGQKEEKQDMKFGIFHMLGKFLYGKRLNLEYNPNGKKKNNEISTYYTELQLQKLDPPFYFQPVPMLQRSHVSTSTFIDLLEQNFLQRFGKVRDIRQMYGLFLYYDTCKEQGLSYGQRYLMEPHLKQLLTWGVLIYNRNSNRDSKGMCSIQRARNNVISRLLKQKHELIKAHYLNTSNNAGAFRHKVKDILRFAHFLRLDKTKNTLPFYLQRLVEIVKETGKRGPIGEIDSKQNVVGQNQEQEESCGGLGEIGKTILAEGTKKSKLFKLVMEDSDQSDIDSD